MGFVAGLLTGTPALFGCRYTVVGKSPLTATWGDANCGGDFGPYLKFSGYDAIFLSGVSPEPVYLFINDGTAELRRGDHLWGKDIHDTEALLQDELGPDARIACIGPAAERLCLISCIINNRGRAAGRSGLGAVMGAKRLKAVVVKGSQQVPVADKAKPEQATGTGTGGRGSSPLASVIPQWITFLAAWSGSNLCVRFISSYKKGDRGWT